jgi:DNA repair protein SbcC/Rad50
VAAWAWTAHRGGSTVAGPADPDVVAREHAHREREAAAAEARAMGLPADPEILERQADRRREAERAATEAAAWDARRAELERARIGAIEALDTALQARGVVTDGSPLEAFAAYEAACRVRAEAATRSGARDALTRALAARRSAEAAAAASSRAVERAAASLGDAAAEVGIATDSEPDELAAGLEEWQRARAADAERADRARQEWHELATLLDNGSLEELRDAAARAVARSESLGARLDPAQVAHMAARADLGQLIEVERDELERAREEASSARGALDQMRLDLPDVAEAEEAVAEATAELDRVTGTAEVIDATTRLLRAAEERVHRDLAPILASGITRWLPRVSGGRYVDASVDPADLSVKVKEAATGRWRSALLLSEGTREQIYLLLRAEMAQRLSTTGETAPLLLDEVTAQADAERKVQILDVLHELSAERQIVLFTHDDDVVIWAERSLGEQRDRLIHLPLAAGERQMALR